MSSRLERDLELTLDRLRGRSLARLARPLQPSSPGPAGNGPTAAQAAADLAQHLVDVTASIEGGPIRQLPEVEVHVLPDLLAVAGHDLLTALSTSELGATDRQLVGDDAAAALRALRHAL